MSRSRTKYLIAAGAAVTLGLASRRYSGALPEFTADYAGDTLWALTAFLGLVGFSTEGPDDGLHPTPPWQAPH